MLRPADDAADDAKRTRTCASSSEAAAVPQAAWPSAASLYAQGLADRAESLSSESWSVQGKEWRASLNAADANRQLLKQRQAEMRQLMLQQQQQPARPAAGHEQR